MKEFVIEKLSEEHCTKRFDCKNSTINNYLRINALIDNKLKKSNSQVLLQNGEIIAYFTLGITDFNLKNDESDIFDYYCINLEYIGVDEKYQHQGIGTKLLDYVIMQIQPIAEYIGSRFFVLDALLEKIKWYESIGFQKMEDMKYEERKTVTMYMDFCNIDDVYKFFEE